MTNLRAGIARVDITPPVPIDCMGFVRRSEPAIDVLAPLTATALVVHDDETDDRVAIVAFDLVGIGVEQGRRVRHQIGELIGCPAENVLLNYSHTHAGPHTFGDGPKLGGDLRHVNEVERAYIESIPHLLVSAAHRAKLDLEPVRIGAATGSADGISVNRRERTADGRTILGWNPDGVLDTDVPVVRIDRADGTAKAVLVGFACHPVVLGGEHPMVGPDYPGAVRDVIESATGATCMFLMGAAGDVLPLEGFHEHEGPERRFGERVAYEALAAFSRIRTSDTTIERIEYGSVTPITLFRHVPVSDTPPQRVGGATEVVEFPLKPLPDLETIERELDDYRSAVEAARADGADQARLNPLDYHVIWAESARQQLLDGTAQTSVDGTLQVIRIGDVAFAAIPGEPFNEIGLAVKAQSAAPFTFVCGYSNEYIAYFPTAAEYPHGGYEPGYSHHNSRRLEQVDHTCEERIVSTLTNLSHRLFHSDHHPVR